MAGMNFLQRLGTNQSFSDAGQSQMAQLALLKLKMQQAQDEQKGRQLAGNLFPQMFGGSASVPGATALPWSGGGSPPPSPIGLPNGGAPPVPGANPAPPAPAGGPPAGAPPAMGTPPGQTNGLSWQQLAMAIKKQAPDADGATIMEVIQQYAPLMNQQSKMDIAMMQMMVRDTIAQMNNATREDIADKNIGGRKAVANINQSGANSRANQRRADSGGIDYKTAAAELKRAQSNLNNVRASTPKDTAAIKAAQDEVTAARKAVQDAKATGGAGPSSAGEGQDMVNVISPDGTPGQIPRANLDAALEAGYKQQ